jgi:transposase
MNKKQNYIYVGVDLHKETHTAVIINCWNEKLGEITFENKPKAFKKLIKFIEEKGEGNTPVVGLENASGYGRDLAIYLLAKDFIVKDVNPSLAFVYRKSAPQTKKDDSHDAYCVAKVLIMELDSLPNANPTDIYWTLSQLSGRRNNIVESQVRLKNQLHEHLSNSYKCYKSLFSELDSQTSLFFWDKYPSKQHIEGVNAETLAYELRKVSHNNCSIRKAEYILETIKSDGEIKKEYQDARDFIIRNLVKDINFKKQELKEIEIELKKILKILDFQLETMPGISTIMAGNLLAEIGDINRFSSADKLAKFAGIAPIKFSSAGKGTYQKSKQGNRRLFAIFYFLAIQMVQCSKVSGKQRNEVFYEYYQRKISEGKTKTQALVCITRRLVNIIYGMLKNKTEYRKMELNVKIAV